MCSCSGSCNCNSTTIPRGPQGVPGPQGDTGLPGTNGINGITPTITIGDVTTVPFGDDATVTNVGVFPNAVFDFEIPEGEQGIQGEPGPVSVERIKADVFSNPGTGFNALLNVTFNELIANGQIITFTITSGTEDNTGVFGSTGFSISNGVTTTSLFVIGPTAPNFGTAPAKIKFDRTPTLSPTGYESNELINFITADIKISRIASNSATIEGTIYGYNTENQTQFGLSKFAQKIWHLRTGFIYPANFTIISSTSDDGSGGSTGMTNILRYNTTL
jgi:hypothetical protein